MAPHLRQLDFQNHQLRCRGTILHSKTGFIIKHFNDENSGTFCVTTRVPKFVVRHGYLVKKNPKDTKVTTVSSLGLPSCVVTLTGLTAVKFQLNGSVSGATRFKQA